MILYYACFSETDTPEIFGTKALLAVVLQACLPQIVLRWQVLRNEHLLPTFRRLDWCVPRQHLQWQISREELSPLVILQLVVQQRRMHR